jgi:hypothetical protein
MSWRRSLGLGLALALCASAPARAQIAFAQAASTQTFGGTIATSGNVTANNLLVLCAVVASASDGTVTGVTDTRSSSWALADRVTLSNRDVSLWYAVAGGTGSLTATVTVSGTLDSQHMVIAEYSGLLTSGVLGDTSVGGPTTSTSASSGNVATTSADALVSGCTGIAFSGVTYTATGSFTQRGVDVGQRSVLTDRIVSSTGSYDATGTLSPSEEWGVVAAEFKATGGGGGGIGRPVRRLMLGVGQ